MGLVLTLAWCAWQLAALQAGASDMAGLEEGAALARVLVLRCFVAQMACRLHACLR